MLKLTHRLGAALVLAAVAAGASALGPGAPAPALDVKTWYKGTPVKEFSEKGTYVVEFWATWCGPCRTTIPHLTKLAKANPDVKFIGVSIWEDDDGSNVKNFVTEMGDQMDYIVGYSGNQTGMAESWMKAAGQNGIPSAFIVKDRKIQWIGHPMAMDKPLEQVKAGTFDVAAFKAEFDKEQAEEKRQMEIRRKLADIRKQYNDGKVAEAKAALDTWEKENPQMKALSNDLRLNWLVKEDPKAFEERAEKAFGSKNMNEMMPFLMIAINQSQPNGNRDLGNRIVEMAFKGTEEKDPLVLYYGANFYMRTKDFAKATSALEKAQAALPNSQMKDNKQFKDVLDKMLTEARAGGK